MSMGTDGTVHSMNTLERELLRGQVGEESPRLMLRTGTRVDAGSWLRGAPLWLCVMSDDLVLLAVSRRRYVQKIPLDHCRASRYCAMTGELILEPVDTLRYPRLALEPADALRALQMIAQPPDESPPHPTVHMENDRA
ncbi:MAG: hypothetical protein GC164_09660 [Phycisphaera sp.]|nr:hypothetical protein [Phycisphaera sp.]